MKKVLLLVAVALMAASCGSSKKNVAANGPDPNFYIYLCFGQSNMEGNSNYEQKDLEGVSPRFLMMAAVPDSTRGREAGKWYTATPPLCRPDNGICPVDWFGRTMVENLPENVRVGVLNVAVGGCRIEVFMKDRAVEAGKEYQWMQRTIKNYDGNAYEHLIKYAKLAQKDGVIKGILMHQAESNIGEEDWPEKVKYVYNTIIEDLGLDAKQVPLLAGEVVSASAGGPSASMNEIVDKLPSYLENSYVISSEGCASGGHGAFDKIHFSAAGYRELGRRYAVQMLSLMGINNPVLPQ